MPAHLKGEPHLVLQYGYDLPITIPDLQVDEHGVSATLSFELTPRATVVPWSAVYVVTAQDGRGVLYQEDIPSDVSVIAASGGDSGKEGDGSAAHAAGGLPAGDGQKPTGTADDDSSAGVPAPRAATPSRALRAVPLTGPLEEDHPAMASVSYGGAGLGASASARRGTGTRGTDTEMMGGAPPEAMVPARRRRRPQLRLVK